MKFEDVHILKFKTGHREAFWRCIGGPQEKFIKGILGRVGIGAYSRLGHIAERRGDFLSHEEASGSSIGKKRGISGRHRPIFSNDVSPRKPLSLSIGLKSGGTRTVSISPSNVPSAVARAAARWERTA